MSGADAAAFCCGRCVGRCTGPSTGGQGASQLPVETATEIIRRRCLLLLSRVQVNHDGGGGETVNGPISHTAPKTSQAGVRTQSDSDSLELITRMSDVGPGVWSSGGQIRCQKVPLAWQLTKRSICKTFHSRFVGDGGGSKLQVQFWPEGGAILVFYTEKEMRTDPAVEPNSCTQVSIFRSVCSLIPPKAILWLWRQHTQHPIHTGRDARREAN